MNFQGEREAGSRKDKASPRRQNSRPPFSLHAKLLLCRVTYCASWWSDGELFLPLFKGDFPEWTELFLRVFKRMPTPQVHKGNGLVSTGKRPWLWLPLWAGIVWGFFENLLKWERSLLRDVKFHK